MFVFSHTFLYYGNLLYPCSENYINISFTKNIWETHNFGMFVFSHTFLVLWKPTFPMFWEFSMKQKSKWISLVREKYGNTEISLILRYLVHLQLMRTHAIPNVWECTNSHKMEIFCEKQYHSQAVGFWGN